MLRSESSRRWGLLLRLLCGTSCLGFACVPLDDLSGYSVPPVDAGDSSQAGAGSLPQPDAGGSGGAASTSDASSQSGAGNTSSMDDAGTGDADVPGDAATTCTIDMGFVSQDSCYLVVTQPETWTEGLASCETWGGSLATLESVAENDALAPLLEEDVWIGLNDRDVEGTFVWADGQEAAFEFPWAAEQPNDFMGQDCVQRQQVSSLWLDQACDETRASLCERPL